MPTARPLCISHSNPGLVIHPHQPGAPYIWNVNLISTIRRSMKSHSLLVLIAHDDYQQICGIASEGAWFMDLAGASRVVRVVIHGTYDPNDPTANCTILGDPVPFRRGHEIHVLTLDFQDSFTTEEEWTDVSAAIVECLRVFCQVDEVSIGPHASMPTLHAALRELWWRFSDVTIIKPSTTTSPQTRRPRISLRKSWNWVTEWVKEVLSNWPNHPYYWTHVSGEATPSMWPILWNENL